MKLETSTELLERVRAKHSVSWYGLARLIPAHENTVRNWRHGRTIVDRKFAPRIAELVEEPAEYVLACIESEREPSAEVRKVWQRIASKFRSKVASVLLAGLALVGMGSPTRSEAYSGAPEAARPAMYIMLNYHLLGCGAQALALAARSVQIPCRPPRAPDTAAVDSGAHTQRRLTSAGRSTGKCLWAARPESPGCAASVHRSASGSRR